MRHQRQVHAYEIHKCPKLRILTWGFWALFFWGLRVWTEKPNVSVPWHIFAFRLLRELVDGVVLSSSINRLWFLSSCTHGERVSRLCRHGLLISPPFFFCWGGSAVYMCPHEGWSVGDSLWYSGRNCILSVWMKARLTSCWGSWLDSGLSSLTFCSAKCHLSYLVASAAGSFGLGSWRR
jgi:hypothetical protein